MELKMQLEFRRYGGLIERSGLDRDSALGSAWKIGEYAAQMASERIETTNHEVSRTFQFGITNMPKLNAVARRLEKSYLAAIFWPLPLVIQGVSAAVWANPHVAPWVGDTSKLTVRTSFDDPTPPGFDFFLALENQLDIDPSLYRSGVRKDDVEAIVSAGDDRWEAFIATWSASLRFVWGHEFGHILYGHTDLITSEFGLSDIFENGFVERNGVPQDLSHLMEYVADMDAAMNIFTLFYGSYFASGDNPNRQKFLNAGSATTLGILIAIYVLWQSDYLKEGTPFATHPPIEHRATWVLGAESNGVDTLIRRMSDQGNSVEKVELFRDESIRLLQTVAKVHESFFYWISRVDDEAEDVANKYITKIRTGSEAYFERLLNLQMVQ